MREVLGGRWAPTAAVTAVVVALAILVSVARDGGGPIVDAPVSRVLVVSLPGLAWEDAHDGDTPNLDALVREAAVGDVSTRIGRRRASSTDAYLTMGAGTRAVAPTIDVAVALDPDEAYGGVRTADVLQRRLGRVPAGVAYLAAGAALDLNAEGPYGGVPGTLGDRLADAGVHRAVIANADAVEGFVSDEPPPEGSYARGAATMLMGEDGIVPGGTVGRWLLADDPAAPFGRRLDHAAVLSAFDEEWARADRAVVLVEASDLSRAAAYGPRATSAQRRALWDDAVTSSDALLGALLERVDPTTDAVLVVSPVSRGSAPELGLVALRTPDVDGGVLRSATTRRDGYVQLADVAPTVLRLLGEPEPDDIEGRAFEVAPRPTGGRTAELASEATAAGFRDSIIALVVTLVVVALALLAGAARWRSRLPDGVAAALPFAAHAALGIAPSTFLAGEVRALVGATGAYLCFVAAVSAVLGAVTWAIDRWRPGLGPIVALAGTVGLFAADVLLGAPLQVNTVFGYSLAVAGRFAGFGNLVFALFGAATILLGVSLVDRYGERARAWTAALFVGVVLLEGLPMLGADVGGVLSMVPAFGITLLVLGGRRPRGRELGLLTVAAFATVMVFAFVDTLLPGGEQSHLARLADHLVHGRIGSLSDSLTRRVQASFGALDTAVWFLVLGLVAAVGAYVILISRVRPRERALLPAASPPVAAAALGLLVLAVIGLVANDSSVAVPATMLIPLTPVAVLHVLRRRPLSPEGLR